MILKFGMEHYVIELYEVYINYDPELTMTYFTKMANFVKFVFCIGTYIRPRYQVSFYRTIGPLVLEIICSNMQCHFLSLVSRFHK